MQSRRYNWDQPPAVSGRTRSWRWRSSRLSKLRIWSLSTFLNLRWRWCNNNLYRNTWSKFLWPMLEKTNTVAWLALRIDRNRVHCRWPTKTSVEDGSIRLEALHWPMQSISSGCWYYCNVNEERWVKTSPKAYPVAHVCSNLNGSVLMLALMKWIHCHGVFQRLCMLVAWRKSRDKRVTRSTCNLT